MKRMFSAVLNVAKTNDLVLYIYDQIGASFWEDGVTAKSVATALADAGKVDSITLRINSPGGDVFEGLAIFNLLRSQGVPVNVMIDGLAASAASTLAMVGDTITIGDNAMMMIHNAWMVSVGDAAELRKAADMLDKITGTLVDTYAKRTHQSAEDITAMMAAETWLNAQDCMDKGFATAILTSEPDDAKAAKALAASFNLGRRFARVPEAMQPEAAAPEPPAKADNSKLALDLLRIDMGAVA